MNSRCRRLDRNPPQPNDGSVTLCEANWANVPKYGRVLAEIDPTDAGNVSCSAGEPSSASRDVPWIRYNRKEVRWPDRIAVADNEAARCCGPAQSEWAGAE